MRIVDLGALSGPVFVAGGVHGNLTALGAVLREARRAGVPPGRVIMLGGIVGPLAHSGACLAALRAFGGPLLAGPEERALIERRPAPEGAPAGEAGWWARLQAEVGPGLLDWLETLPEAGVLAHEGRRFGLVGARPSDPARPLWPDAGADVLRREIAAFSAAAGPVDGLIVAGSGLAFQRVVDGVFWFDVGAVSAVISGSGRGAGGSSGWPLIRRPRSRPCGGAG